MGSDRTCDINLSQYPDVASRHLRLSCDRVSNIWYVEDLGTTVGTYIDGKAISRSLIEQTTAIKLANSVLINAQPLVLTPIAPPPQAYVPPQPQVYQPAPVTNQGYAGPNVPQQAFSSASTGFSGSPDDRLRVLSWGEYVHIQVSKQANILNQMTMRFFMVTGFRDASWVLDLDGYIIPNFEGSAESIALGLEKELGTLRKYENTDCYVVRLTDTHVEDSFNSPVLGAQWAAIKRGGKADYRRFCVVSYNNIRTYLNIENYGTDLFVSRITRYEPETDSSGIIGLLVFAMLLFVIIALGVSEARRSMYSSNSGDWMGTFFLAIMPLLVWAVMFLLVPAFMQAANILPRKSNSIIIYLLTFFFYIIAVPTMIFYIVIKKLTQV